MEPLPVLVRRRTVGARLGLCAAALFGIVVLGCTASSSGGAVSESQSYGMPPSVLTIDPASSTPVLSEREARRALDRPEMSAASPSKLVQFGYYDVTVSGDVFNESSTGANAGKHDPRPFNRKLAWVAVYQTTGDLEVHCRRS
jgi:hypothetical protein